MKSKSRFVSLLSWLVKYKHASRPRLLARLLRDEEGSYLIYGVAILPVLIGVSGLASEGGLLFYNHRTLQSAADGAAYSAAIAYSSDTSPDITTQAKAIVASYGFALGTGNNQANVSATATTFAGQPAIQVTISRPQTALFSRMDALPVLSNSVSATAILNSNSNASGNCLLSFGMNPLTGTNDVSSAIALQGNPIINLNTCGVFTNSTDCTAAGGVSVAIGGNGTLTAGSVGSAGCITVTGSSQICTMSEQQRIAGTTTCSPPAHNYTQGDGTLSDPYGTVSIPTTSSAGSCTATTSVLTTPPNKKGQVSADGTLCPGVYPNGIWVKGNTVTLQPGIYILDYVSGNPAAPFQVGPGGGTVTGNGVTLVFTSTSSYPATPQMMDIQSNANVTLTAPTTGATAGFVLMGDRTMPYGYLSNGNTSVGSTFSTAANATVNLNGTVYLPHGLLNWQGNAATALGCRQFLVNTIVMGGTPGLNSNGCRSGGLTAGQKSIGSIVTLVQ